METTGTEKGQRKGRWTKKMVTGKETKGERNREDMKRRAQAKKITKTAKVRVLERSGFKKKKEQGFKE
jgi:hypothetical protein